MRCHMSTATKAFKNLRWWVGALQHQVSSYRRDVNTLSPGDSCLLAPIEAGDCEWLEQETDRRTGS